MSLSFCLSRRSALKASLLTPIILTGCVTYGAQMPTATANFTPKVTYPVAYDDAWAEVISTLSANSIPIASSSQDTGQIITSPIAGEGVVGLLENISTQYVYTIFLIKAGADSTTINIMVALQSSAPDGGFRDVSASNTGIVTGLRNSLYQKLEPSLK